MNRTQTTYKLIQLLSDGHFHSGEDLGKTLAITRSAVWKAIKQLNTLGVTIESVTSKGYRIPHGIELLSASDIEHHIDKTAKKQLDELMILDVTGSTNDDLLNCVKSQPNKNIACFAEYQTKARGRRGRHWVTSFGTNIDHSLLWHFSKDPAEIVGLSLAIAVAVTRTLKKYGINEDIQLKWPNDILWRGRKLAGVLLEMVAENHGHCAVIIGVGVNTYLPHQHTAQIDQPWVDIQTITDAPPKRNQLAGLLLNELIRSVQQFEKEGLIPFLETWRQKDAMIGKNVTLETYDGKINGIMDNVSDQGELILRDAAHRKKRYLSGELSVRLTKKE